MKMFDPQGLHLQVLATEMQQRMALGPDAIAMGPKQIARAIELARWPGMPDGYDETAPVVCLRVWDGRRPWSQLIYLGDLPSRQVIEDRLTVASAEMKASDANVDDCELLGWRGLPEHLPFRGSWVDMLETIVSHLRQFEPDKAGGYDSDFWELWNQFLGWCEVARVSITDPDAYRRCGAQFSGYYNDQADFIARLPERHDFHIPVTDEVWGVLTSERVVVCVQEPPSPAGETWAYWWDADRLREITREGLLPPVPTAV